MTAPGGNEVSRVSVRVSPDTDQFREELRAQLEAMTDLTVQVQVEFELNTEELRARLAAMNETIRVEVEVEDPDIDNTARIRAELNIDMAHFREQIARIEPVRLRTELDVDRDRLGGLLGGGGGGDSGGGAGSGLISTYALRNIVQGLTMAIALAPVLAAGGAAVAAAWGLVSTAIAVIPSAIFLLAGPIAAIALGVEGIKTAAQAIAPEFDELKSKLESTFETGFAPVFENLRSLFDDEIQNRLIELAETTSEVAENLSELAVDPTFRYDLIDTFNGAEAALLNLNPAIEDFLRTMMTIGSNPMSFAAITDPIREFAAEFRATIEELNSNGTLTDAFIGLDAVLSGLTVGFADLVHNGIELWAAAWPGVKVFIDGLTEFFNNLDWERLGGAVSAVFEGLGTALGNVDQATLDSITAAFEDLGDVFTDPAYQRMFQDLLRDIPEVITLLGALTGAFFRIATGASGVIQILYGLATAIEANFLYLTGQIDFAEYDAMFDNVAEQFREGSQKITDALAPMEGTLTEWGQKVSDKTRDSLEKVNTELQAGNAKLKETARAGVVEIESSLQPGDKDYVPPWTDKVEKIGGAVSESLIGAATKAQDGAAKVGEAAQPPPGMDSWPFWRSVFLNLAAVVGVGTGDATSAAAAGSEAITQAAQPQGGPSAIQSIWDLAFGAISGGITSMFGDAQAAAKFGADGTITAATPDGAALGQGWTAATPTVEGAATTMLSTVTASLIAQMTTTNTLLTNGFASMADAVLKGLLTIQVPLDAFGLNLTNFGLLWQNLALLIQNAMLVIQTAVQSGLLMIDAAFLAAGVGLTNFGLLFTNLVNLIVLQMQVMVLAVQTGLDQIVLSFQNGIDLITNLLTQATVTWTQLVTDAMAQMTLAVQNGMAQAVLAVQDGVTQMTAALDAAVPAFSAAGANMGQALADGLRSKQGEVEAAASALAESAAAATAAAAQIASPSKVFTRLGEFMGLGVAVGFDKSKTVVGRSARGVVGALVDTVSKIADSLEGTDLVSNLEATMPSKFSSTVDGDLNGAISSDGFGSISDRVGEALEGWTVQIDGNGMAKLVNKSNTRKARRG